MVLLRGFSLRLSKFTGHSSFLKRPEKVNEKNFKKIATKQTFKEGLENGKYTSRMGLSCLEFSLFEMMRNYGHILCHN